MIVDKDGNIQMKDCMTNEEFMIELNDNPTDEELRRYQERWRKGPYGNGPRPPWMYPKDHPMYRPKEKK
jgi:hypothetical protein